MFQKHKCYAQRKDIFKKKKIKSLIEFVKVIKLKQEKGNTQQVDEEL